MSTKRVPGEWGIKKFGPLRVTIREAADEPADNGRSSRVADILADALARRLAKRHPSGSKTSAPTVD